LTEKDKHNWLVNRYQIAYAPSLSALREIIQRSNKKDTGNSKDILAIGDPYLGQYEEKNPLSGGKDILQDFYSNSTFRFARLKYSGLEIEKIASLFKTKNVDILKGKRASEDDLKKRNLSDYKIIHFATHSLIDDKKPARSSILLSLNPEAEEDGFLQMREIFNLKLHAELVVLSACQTGLGQFIRGEGIESLSRAFFKAGASSVLMSLWAVNDQASYQLMERFYSRLRSSDSPIIALQKAKRDLINSDLLSHPYYWAGFIIKGDVTRTLFPHAFPKWIIAMMISGFVMVFYLTLKRTNGRKVKLFNKPRTEFSYRVNHD
jgi:CHAT domain-containing protein